MNFIPCFYPTLFSINWTFRLTLQLDWTWTLSCMHFEIVIVTLRKQIPKRKKLAWKEYRKLWNKWKKKFYCTRICMKENARIFRNIAPEIFIGNDFLGRKMRMYLVPIRMFTPWKLWKILNQQKIVCFNWSHVWFFLLYNNENVLKTRPFQLFVDPPLPPENEKDANSTEDELTAAVGELINTLEKKGVTEIITVSPVLRSRANRLRVERAGCIAVCRDAESWVEIYLPRLLWWCWRIK